MDEYINKTKLIETMSDIDMLDKEEIEELPTEDVAPIKHGKWEEIGYWSYGKYFITGVKCSICGLEKEVALYQNYCQCCGAKMDLEE